VVRLDRLLRLLLGGLLWLLLSVLFVASSS